MPHESPVWVMLVAKRRFYWRRSSDSIFRPYKRLQQLALIPFSRSLYQTLWPDPPSIVAARAQVAMRLALMTTALGLGLFSMDRFMGVPATPDSLLTLVLAAMGALTWVLLKRRYFKCVSWLVVVFLFGMTAASTWFFGSIRTVNLVLLAVGLVAAGIFLRRRDLIWTTLAAMAFLGLLTWVDASGLLAGQTDFKVGWRTWVTQSASLLSVAMMMNLNRTHMQHAQALHLDEATQRLKTQLDRDLGQQRFVRLFESSPAPLFVQSTRTGAILDVNSAFERVLGYARSEVLHRREGFLWLHDEDHRRFVRNRRATRRTDWQPITALCRNGERLVVQISSERDDDPEDSLMITALRVPGHMPGARPSARTPQQGPPHA